MPTGFEDEGPLRVLVAEDETIIRLDLCGLLERHGLRVCGEARDGEEAVRLARLVEPDIVLIDVRMPALDGIEAARRIHAERPLPIVVLTAHADRGFVERAIGAGVFAYLVKPFRESEVVPAIRTAVARHRELVAARRRLGGETARSLVVGLHSPRGTAWPPLRLERRSDGSIEVEVA